MSFNQVRGTTTNLSKLVAWDVDLFRSLSDDKSCIICISEQEKYVLGQVMGHLLWGTRWTSQQGSVITQSEKQKISGEVAYLMSQETCYEICDDVADCIDESEAVIESLNNAIINALSTNSEVQNLVSQIARGLPDTAPQQVRLDYEAYNESVSCDKDKMYGYAKALWGYIDARSVDGLERLAQAGNLVDQVNVLLGVVIPGFDVTPIDDVLDWIGNLADYGLEAYNAQKSIELEQEIICDLFCLSVDNGCTLDFGTVLNYFIGKMGGVNVPNVLSTFTDWVTYMVLGNYPNDKIVYLWSAFQLALATIGYEYIGLDTIQPYAINARTGDPDDDWELLCTDCQQWCYVFEPRWTDKQGWVFLQGRNISDVLWSNNGTVAPIETEYDMSFTTVNEIKVVLVLGNTKANSFMRLKLYDGVTEVFSNVRPTPSGYGLTEYAFDVSSVVSFDKINVYAQAGTVPDVNLYLLTIELSGDGVNPIGVNNC